MTGIYEKVIKNTKKIESLIEEKLNAEGKGLYEKSVSVEEYLEQEIVKKIRRIATIRNKLMHEDEFELADTVSFEEDCKEIIYYLSTTEFDSTVIPVLKNTKQPLNARLCKSCGADTKPILRVINGGFFTKERIRHICAICGENMYVTGGGWTWFAKGLFLYSVLYGGYFYISIFLSSERKMEMLVFLVITGLLSIIPAKIAERKGRSFRSWWCYGFFIWIVALIHSLLLKPK